MQKIQYIKNYKNKTIGEIEDVSNNIAFGLIDSGIARLYKGELLEQSQDKMMRTKGRKRKIATLNLYENKIMSAPANRMMGAGRKKYKVK